MGVVIQKSHRFDVSGASGEERKHFHDLLVVDDERVEVFLLVRKVEFLDGGDFVDAAAPFLGVTIALALVLLGALFDLRNEVTERARWTQRQPAPRLLLRHTHARTPHTHTEGQRKRRENTRYTPILISF
jgi:hypothetical protein